MTNARRANGRDDNESPGPGGEIEEKGRNSAEVSDDKPGADYNPPPMFVAEPQSDDD